MPGRLKSARIALLQLVGGSAIAQAIPLLLSPFLTRLFGPEEYGLLAIVSSVAALISVVAAGRYDLALIEPRDNASAQALLVGATGLTLIVATVVLTITIATVFAGDFLLARSDVRIALLAAPAAACLSLYGILLAWLNRSGDFRGMAIARVINGAGSAIAALALGIFGFISAGLLAGFFIGLLTAIVFQLYRSWPSELAVSRVAVLATMKEYCRYPQFLIPATAAGTIASEAPILVFMRYFDSVATGFFSLAIRVVAAPLSLIGNAIGEVYRKHAVDEFNANGNCRLLFVKSFSALAIIGLMPWAILFFYGPELFAIIFGEAWRQAGEFSVYLSFMVYFQLLSTPLANTIILNHSQKKDMLLQFGRMVMALSALAVGVFREDIELAIMLYSAVFSMYYMAHSYLQFRAASGLK